MKNPSCCGSTDLHLLRKANFNRTRHNLAKNTSRSKHDGNNLQVASATNAAQHLLSIKQGGSPVTAILHCLRISLRFRNILCFRIKLYLRIKLCLRTLVARLCSRLARTLSSCRRSCACSYCLFENKVLLPFQFSS